MRSGTLAAVAASAALVGCPIPQPLPDYPAGTITPPRIVVDQIARPETVVRVPASCTNAPTYALAARLIDVNTLERVVARWFVNYDPLVQPRYTPEQEDDIPGVDATPPETRRDVPPFDFHPYDHVPIDGTGADPKAPGNVKIVELVVSNGFDPSADAPPAAWPRRTALPGFETQVYRWIFLTVAPSTGCTPGEPGCVTCPP